MALPIGIYNLASRNLSVLDIIYLELFRMSEMLEYLSIFISYRYLHMSSLLFHTWGF